MFLTLSVNLTFWFCGINCMCKHRLGLSSCHWRKQGNFFNISLQLWDKMEIFSSRGHSWVGGLSPSPNWRKLHTWACALTKIFFQNYFREAGCLPVIVELLSRADMLVQVACGNAIANMAVNAENQVVLKVSISLNNPISN